MKNGLKSIGKASLYFGVYFLAQAIVGAVLGAVISVGLTAELMATGQALDEALLMEQMTAKILEMTSLMVLVSGAIALVIYGIIFLVRKKNMAKEICLTKIDMKSILPIVIMAVGFNLLITLVLNLIPFPENWMESYMANSGGLQEGNTIINWVSVVIMAPVVEEIVFRGLIYTRLKKGMPALVAAFLCAIVFGAMHGTIIWFMYAFVLGMLLVWCMEKYQSLTASILFHMAFNLTGQLLSLLPVASVIW